MVEFLVERGADVNRGDNEGWTPLHATASCGFLSIARYIQNSIFWNESNVGLVYDADKRRLPDVIINTLFSNQVPP